MRQTTAIQKGERTKECTSTDSPGTRRPATRAAEETGMSDTIWTRAQFSSSNFSVCICFSSASLQCLVHTFEAIFAAASERSTSEVPAKAEFRDISQYFKPKISKLQSIWLCEENVVRNWSLVPCRRIEMPKLGLGDAKRRTKPYFTRGDKGWGLSGGTFIQETGVCVVRQFLNLTTLFLCLNLIKRTQSFPKPTHVFFFLAKLIQTSPTIILVLVYCYDQNIKFGHISGWFNSLNICTTKNVLISFGHILFSADWYLLEFKGQSWHNF